MDNSQVNSQNTTIESIPPFEQEENPFIYDPDSQGSLHLSDLDVNENEDSINTTVESMEGGKRKSNKKYNKKSKKNTGKKSKRKNNKNKNKKGKKTIKRNRNSSRKNKHGGNNLEESLKKSEKQILPKDENPAF
jgi:hypothetical protein